MEQPLQLTIYNLQLPFPFPFPFLFYKMRKLQMNAHRIPHNWSRLLSKPNISLPSFDYQNNLIYVAPAKSVCVELGMPVSFY